MSDVKPRSGFFKGPRGTINASTVTEVRKWAEGCLGASTSRLIMFREGNRNRVLLRFTLDDGYGEIDVSTLKAIRDRRLKRPEAEKALKEVCRAS